MVLGRVLYGPEHAKVHAVPWMGACARRATFAEIVERTEQLAPHVRPPPLPDQFAYVVSHASQDKVIGVDDLLRSVLARAIAQSEDGEALRRHGIGQQ